MLKLLSTYKKIPLITQKLGMLNVEKKKFRLVKS